MVRPLKKYEDYTREEVHDIFSPYTRFVPGAGTFGLQGLVKIPGSPSSFVFFVTYGRQQGGHLFEEDITKDGILTWQSQPKQKLSSLTIRQLIDHDYLRNNIHLFLRTSRDLPYTYLGCLAYVGHDSERERPVYFKWQILDWDIPLEKAKDIGLELEELEAITDEPKAEGISYQLTETFPPTPKARTGLPTVEFKGRHVDYDEGSRRKTALGNAGELAVLETEKQRLIDQGRADLADGILHVSKIEGDGAGYDIKSYTPEGKVKYIEVKTTKGGPNSSFYISSREVAFSEEYCDNYYLYRLYDFDIKTKQGSFFVQKGNVTNNCELQPVIYRAVPT